VAVKKLLKIPGNQNQEEILERWRKEVKNMLLVSSPSVVTVHDFFEEEWTCDLVLEYCSGGNLRTHFWSISITID
jgi:serine/threonine protein kinase